MSDRITITKLSKEKGYWTARVTCNGETIEVDNRYGSWQGDYRHEDGRVTRHFVALHVAELLQAKVRPIENRDRRILEKIDKMDNPFLTD